MKRNNKILASLICILLITLFAVSCKSGEHSGEDSSILNSSEAISEIGSDDNSVTSDESVEVSEEIPGSPTSEDVTTDSSIENSTDVSSESSNDSSEDDLAGNESMDELLQKYKDLESIKALAAIGEKYKDSVHISMRGQVEVSGYLFEMVVDMYGEEKSGNSLSMANFSGMGQTIISQKELVLNGVKYGIDDTNKMYCIIPEEESDSFLGFENIEKVVTKNELVKGEIYTTDWFISKDGSRIGIYTKKSEIKYMCMAMDMGGGEKMEILFEFTFEEMDKDVKFELPKGYVLVDYDAFQGGASM